MKTVNAAVAQSRIASLYLSERRAYTRLCTADIKRSERRKSRRVLNRELSRNCYQGVQDDFGMSCMPVVQVQLHGLKHLPPLVLAKEPTEFRNVIVMRKRANARKSVETLRIPV